MGQAAPTAPDWRRAGADPLSLALIHSRNRTLHLFGALEQQLGPALRVPKMAEINPPLWELGHIGWFQEFWIARNLQRHLGVRCDPDATRLSSVLPGADGWWNSTRVPHDTRWDLDLPDLPQTRDYLLATLESTLDLLGKAAPGDDALYFFRMCLMHEDMHAEAMVMLFQTLGLPLQAPLPPARVVREPVCVPAGTWTMGSPLDDGFAYDNELPPHDVDVPEFEIDAQVVNWSQFTEFIEDGGYDQESLWHPQGWQWLQQVSMREGRRAPRYVDRVGVAQSGRDGAVIQHFLGQPRRMAGTQAAMHMSWWEADAWCRWAGRRLPTEVEWEMAAHLAVRRGFHWGDVWEWTASSFRGLPGFVPHPYREYSQPWFGDHMAVRGASIFSSERIRHPKYRNFYLPERDDVFIGFRSCAI